MRIKEMLIRPGLIAPGILLALGIFLSWNPGTAPQQTQEGPTAYASIQELEGIQKLHSLDGSHDIKTEPDNLPPSGWWVRRGELNPAQYARDFLESTQASSPRDLPGEGWHTVEVPGNLLNSLPVDANASMEAVREQVFWYRKVFKVVQGGSESLAVRLGMISDRDEFYLNGQKVASTGKWEVSRAQAYDKIRLYNLPENLLNRNGYNIILIRIQPYFNHEAGITRSTTALGPAAAMQSDLYQADLANVLMLMVYLTVGSYFLYLYMRRREERANLYFALFAYMLVGYQFLRTQMKYELGIDFFHLKRIEYLTLAAMPIFLFTFVRYLFALPDNRFVRLLDRFTLFIYGLPLGMILLVIASEDVQYWDYYNNAFNLPTYFYYMLCFFGILIYSLVWQHNRDALLMLFGVLGFAFALGFDIMVHLDIINYPRIMSYGFFFFVLSLAFILANRFVRLSIEVEDLNKNLENKVEQRTAELNQSLQEVQALKEQQDGDYFLTSLLIKPLAVDESRSELVGIQMLTEQKKKFNFRGRESEIGGDLNVAHDIKLRDRSYTVFLNGDAMGKSIQGAGGALVLGTVFRSILNRTEHSHSMRTAFPEQWLKRAFLELQDVFVTFDGSMLISIALGLVEEDTGMVYYINAEHPFIALYRAGAASFIEDDLVLRKVGIEGLTGNMQVQTFRMQAGDVLICGSDGRDDLLLGEDVDGQRIINEDEQLFLRTIEAGEGDLKRIAAALKEQGSLTDDLALMRVAYREFMEPVLSNGIPSYIQSALQEARLAFKSDRLQFAFDTLLRADDGSAKSVELAAELARYYIKQRNFQQALPYCERVCKQAPEKDEFIYYLANVNKHLHRYKEAADAGERCRLRNPEHIKNLINLADVYRHLGNMDRMHKLLDQARELEPEHVQVRKLSQLAGV